MILAELKFQIYNREIDSDWFEESSSNSNLCFVMKLKSKSDLKKPILSFYIVGDESNTFKLKLGL
jgi:hypothetical protein